MSSPAKSNDEGRLRNLRRTYDRLRTDAKPTGRVRGLSNSPRTSASGPYAATERGVKIMRTGLGLDKTQIWPQTQQMRSDRFEVHGASLCLLGNGVHVAEAAFEGVTVEDRGGTGLMIGHVDNLFG